MQPQNLFVAQLLTINYDQRGYNPAHGDAKVLHIWWHFGVQNQQWSYLFYGGTRYDLLVVFWVVLFHDDLKLLVGMLYIALCEGVEYKMKNDK